MNTTKANELSLTMQEQNIYDWLQDELSRDIFMARKIFSQEWLKYTDQMNAVHELPVLPLVYCEAFEQYCGDLSGHFISVLSEDLREKRIVLYGYGSYGKIMVKRVERIRLLDNIVAVWDQNLAYTNISVGNVRVQPPPQSLSDSIEFDIILVATGTYDKEVADFLIRLDVPIERIKICFPVDEQTQYFDPEIILPRLCDNEVFIDGGVFDFGTSRRLLSLNPHVRKIYAFEPNEESYKRIKVILPPTVDIVLKQAAWWSESTTLTFDGNTVNGKPSSTAIQCYAIDDVVPCDENITFIKFDIEGAEMEALRGAERTICRCRPKLAICIYHKPRDYYEIAAYIKSLAPEYKAYIRHYSTLPSETVLYCVI